MTTEYFENLVAEAGLQLLSKQAPRFLVSLRVIHKQTTDGNIVYNSDHVCDILSYEPAEFAMLTPESAKNHIALSKKRLEKAAKAKASSR